MKREVKSGSELFRWDVATWVVITLVIVFMLVIAMVIWPHPFPIPE